MKEMNKKQAIDFVLQELRARGIELNSERPLHVEENVKLVSEPNV